MRHLSVSFYFRRRHAWLVSSLRCGTDSFMGSQQFNGLFFVQITLHATYFQ